MRADLRYAVRQLAGAPGFTATAVAVLALGLGVTTAVLALVQALLFAPPPYRRPAEVVQLFSRQREQHRGYRPFSHALYTQVRQQNAVFSEVAAHQVTTVAIGEGPERRAQAQLASASFFALLEAKPLRGRSFLAAEDRPGSGARVVLVSHRFWARRGLDPALLGSVLRINGLPFTVVGIMPPSFTGTAQLFAPELWLPLGSSDAVMSRPLDDPREQPLLVLGRLRPGVSAVAAGPALEALARRLEGQFPDELRERTFSVAAPARFGASPSPDPPGVLGALSALLLGMAALVLVVACLNIASMLQARGAERSGEIAIRQALGAGRLRIVRQLLVEGLLLAVAGGAAGVILSMWACDLAVSYLGSRVPEDLVWQTSPGPALLAATFAVCVLATAVFALGPALTVSRGDPRPHLAQGSSRNPVAGRRRWTRHPLLVVQLAVSLALLTAGGLFVRSARQAARMDVGLQIERNSILEVQPPPGRAADRDIPRRVVDRLTALPGVESASVSTMVPFGLTATTRKVDAPGAAPVEAVLNGVGPAYFSTVGLPLLRGRAFTTQEAWQEPARVAVVDERLAAQLWPDGSALGRRLRLPAVAGPGEDLEVIGVARAAPFRLFESRPKGALYLPLPAAAEPTAFLHVRWTVPPDDHAARLRQAVLEEVPGLLVLSAQTFRQHLEADPNQAALSATAAMFGGVGLLALLLAMVGVYGVRAYAVARRTREIGVRMALGAREGAVLWTFLREGLVLLGAGLALGLLLAAAGGRLLAGLLYGVAPLDPWAFAIAAAMLTLATVLACWLPARRATRVDPAVALRG
jgi:predicted permease